MYLEASLGRGKTAGSNETRASLALAPASRAAARFLTRPSSPSPSLQELSTARILAAGQFRRDRILDDYLTTIRYWDGDAANVGAAGYPRNGTEEAMREVVRRNAECRPEKQLG